MHDKNTDTGSVPVSIAGFSESGVNAKRTGSKLPAAALNLSSGNAGSCCNRRVIRVFVICDALWYCFRNFQALEGLRGGLRSFHDHLLDFIPFWPILQG